MTQQALQTEPARLSQSALWERQRGFFVREGAAVWTRNVIPRYITTNPFIAHAYAEVLLAYLEDCSEDGRAAGDACEPAHIVELGAGSGQFSFHFLQHLAPLYDESARAARPFRYVMTDISEANIEHWRAHEQLRPFVEAGVLDFARFDACRDEELHLLVSGQRLGRAARGGPVAFIANYVFDCLPQDAFELRGGELHECLLDAEAEPALDDGPGEAPPNQPVELDYHARPCSFDFYERDDWNATLRGYGESLREGAFLFPVGALRCLETLGGIAGGRFMLLAADKGPHRVGALAGQRRPSLVRHGGCFSLDVNFHALAEQARRAGARVLHSSQDPTHLNAVGFVYGPADAPRAARAFARHLGEFNPDDFYNLMSEATRNARRMSLEAITSLLRLSRWDVTTLLNCYERLVQLLPAAGATARHNFYEAMRAVEARCFRLDPEQNPDFYFGTLAGAMELHEEAIAFYRRAQAVCDTAAAEHNLGMSYLLTSEAGTARRCFARAHLLDERLTPARLMSEKLDAWLSAEAEGADSSASRLSRLENGPALAERLRHSEITLEPLLPRHAGLFHEHATPEILSLTRLPAFASVAEVRGWIGALTADARNYSFAVTHPAHGFVGVVSLLAVGARAGRFFFWLGGPFNGRGYAAAAVCELLRFALDRLALDELFTCVLPRNERSAGVLRRLGFRRAELPGDELHYYRHGVEPLEGDAAAEHIKQLLGANDPRIVVKHLTL